MFVVTNKYVKEALTLSSILNIMRQKQPSVISKTQVFGKLQSRINCRQLSSAHDTAYCCFCLHRVYLQGRKTTTTIFKKSTSAEHKNRVFNFLNQIQEPEDSRLLK